MTTHLAEPPAPRASAPEPPPEPQHPHPARYRRLKRYAAVTALFLAAVVALRLWWGQEAARRLAAEVDAIHARGEPVLPEDFDPPVLAPSVDAVQEYGRAASLVKITPTQRNFQARFEATLPFTQNEMRRLKNILDGNPRALQLARSAQSMHQYGGMTLRSPVSSIWLRGAGPSRQLGSLLQWSALYDHAAGDDAGAVEAVRDALGLGTAVDREAPVFVEHLIAAGIDALTIATLSQITCDLSIEGDEAPAPAAAGTPAPATRAARAPATRAQVLALIGDLLDDEPRRQCRVRGFWGERLMVYDDGPLVAAALPAPLRWPLRPSVDLDTVRVMRRLTQTAAAAAEPNLPAALAKLPPDYRPGGGPDPASKLEQAGRLHSKASRFNFARGLGASYMSLAERRMAAVALAMRLYRADHAGAWPRSLDELVPSYLPAVPADPLAAGGRPLKYVPNAAGWAVPPALAAAEGESVPPPGAGPFVPGPIVYSVGLDGVDDGGSRRPDPAPAKRGHTFGYERSEWRDLVLPLAGNPKVRDPSPASPDDDAADAPAGVGPGGPPAGQGNATMPASR